MSRLYGVLSQACGSLAVALLAVALAVGSHSAFADVPDPPEEEEVGLFCGPGGYHLTPPECSGFCFIGSCKAYGIDNIRASDGTERYPGAGNVTVFHCDC
jgi:acetoin utilization deacetylase AcuC-like enzyme